MSTDGKTLKFRAAKLKGFTVYITVEIKIQDWKMSSSTMFGIQFSIAFDPLSYSITALKLQTLCLYKRG